MSNDMASAPTFSHEKATSPAQKGSALKPRPYGRDEVVSSSVKALQNEKASLNEAALDSLGNIPAEPSPCGAENSWKAKRRAAFRVLNAEQKLLPKMTNLFMEEYEKKVLAGDKDGAKKVLKVMRHSVQKCGADTIPAYRFNPKTGKRVETGAPGQAEVHGCEGPGHVWVGVKRCASTWFCPVCGPKIMSRRRQEVEKGIAFLKNYDGGKHFIFMTLTFPHTYGTSLVEYMDKLQMVLRQFRLGKTWQNFKKRIGLVGYIRAQEVTHGSAGWHPHFHELMITKPLTKKEARDAEAFLSKRWVDMCKKAGLIKHGKIADARAHAVDIRCGADPVSQAYLAKVCAWELSSTTTKATRQVGSRQPFQILADACVGDKQSIRLWSEYMLGMYRKAALYWSPGLKKLCEIEEISDEAILDGEVEKKPILIAEPGAFIQIARRRLQIPILELTEADRMDTIRVIDKKLRLRLVFGEEGDPGGYNSGRFP